MSFLTRISTSLALGGCRRAVRGGCVRRNPSRPRPALDMTTALTHPLPPSSRAGAAPAPDVEIVVPVFNEQLALEGSLRRLHGFLRPRFPFSLADRRRRQREHRRHAGDRPAASYELDRVEVIHLPEKGRGRALRVAWSDGRRARPRVHGRRPVHRPRRAAAAGRAAALRPQRSGHRHAAGAAARTSRGAAERELISRSYNRLLHVVLRARFSDAQCGFKADPRRVAPTACCPPCSTGLVLRHRVAGRGPAPRAADPRGPGRLGRGRRLTGRHRATALGDLRGVARLLLHRSRRASYVGLTSPPDACAMSCGLAHYPRRPRARRPRRAGRLRLTAARPARSSSACSGSRPSSTCGG